LESVYAFFTNSDIGGTGPLPSILPSAS